jgi:acetyl-CoA carboxylase beta subunit
MNSVRPGIPGTTRKCPHCRATILDSASVCPQCRHHLRFDPAARERAESAEVALKVEGTLRSTAAAGAAEYSVVVAVRNDRGEEVSRHVVGVGAIQPGQPRVFTVTVELQPPG